MRKLGVFGLALGLGITASQPIRAEELSTDTTSQRPRTNFTRLAAIDPATEMVELPAGPGADASSRPEPDFDERAGFDPAAHADPGKVDPLHWAALQNQASLLRKLIERGHDADARDGYGRTPLMVAASFGSIESAIVLIGLGAGIDLRDRYGDAPIHFAARGGHAEIVRLLLAEGINPSVKSSGNGEAALHFAAKYGNRATIEALIADGANPNAVDNDGVAPLFYASKRRHGTIVDLLVSLGAREGGLIEAVNANDVERVQKLIAAGADVNTPGLDGTALHLAAAKGYVWIMAMLLDAGADVTAKGEPGNGQPLHLAALHDQVEAVRLLISRGAEIDPDDGWGRTPLHVASAFGAENAGAALLDEGANALATDKVYGDMPIHIAAWNGHVDILKVFLDRGIDINIRSDHEGETPLHYAAVGCQLRMIDFLVASGADLHSTDHSGATPLRYSRFKSTGDLATALLLSLGARE